MSLINEALKRTRDTAYVPGDAGGAGVAAYRIDGGKPAGRNLGISIAVAALVVFVNLGLVGWLVWRNQEHPRVLGIGPGSAAAVPARNPVPVAAPEPARPVTPAPAAPLAVAVSPVPVRVAADVRATASEDAVVAKVLEKIKAEKGSAAPEPETVELPKLVLQGIAGDRRGREAMINGFAFREGDDVEGARVVAIDSQSVKLRFGNREFVLRLR